MGDRKGSNNKNKKKNIKKANSSKSGSLVTSSVDEKNINKIYDENIKNNQDEPLEITSSIEVHKCRTMNSGAEHVLEKDVNKEVGLLIKSSDVELSEIDIPLNKNDVSVENHISINPKIIPNSFENIDTKNKSTEIKSILTASTIPSTLIDDEKVLSNIYREKDTSLIHKLFHSLYEIIEQLLLPYNIPEFILIFLRILFYIPLYLHYIFCKTFFKSSNFDQVLQYGENPKQLLFLVHGMHAAPSTFDTMGALLLEKYKHHNVPVLIYKSNVNTGKFRSHFSTSDGILSGGKRIAGEILQVLHANKSIDTVSFIGHSLGGLYIRSSLPFAFYYDEIKNVWRNRINNNIIHFNLYMSTSTPHVGVRNHLSTWFEKTVLWVYGHSEKPSLIWDIIKKIKLISIDFYNKRYIKKNSDIDNKSILINELKKSKGSYGDSIRDLLLIPTNGGNKPFLLQLAEDDFYSKPLMHFPHRLLCGVADFDAIVPSKSQLGIKEIDIIINNSLYNYKKYKNCSHLICVNENKDNDKIVIDNTSIIDHNTFLVNVLLNKMKLKYGNMILVKHIVHLLHNTFYIKNSNKIFQKQIIQSKYPVHSLETKICDNLPQFSRITCLYNTKPWNVLSHNFIPVVREWHQNLLVGLPHCGKDVICILINNLPLSPPVHQKNKTTELVPFLSDLY